MLLYLFSITPVPPDSNSVVCEWRTHSSASTNSIQSIGGFSRNTHTRTHSLCTSAFCSSLPLRWRYLPFHVCSNISELKMNVHVFCEKSTRKTRKLTLSHPLYWGVKRWHVSKKFFFSSISYDVFGNKWNSYTICLFVFWFKTKFKVPFGMGRAATRIPETLLCAYDWSSNVRIFHFWLSELFCCRSWNASDRGSIPGLSPVSHQHHECVWCLHTVAGHFICCQYDCGEVNYKNVLKIWYFFSPWATAACCGLWMWNH